MLGSMLVRRYGGCDGMLGVTIRNGECDGAGALCVTPRTVQERRVWRQDYHAGAITSMRDANVTAIIAVNLVILGLARLTALVTLAKDVSAWE